MRLAMHNGSHIPGPSAFALRCAIRARGVLAHDWSQRARPPWLWERLKCNTRKVVSLQSQGAKMDGVSRVLKRRRFPEIFPGARTLLSLPQPWVRFRFRKVTAVAENLYMAAPSIPNLNTLLSARGPGRGRGRGRGRGPPSNAQTSGLCED